MSTVEALTVLLPVAAVSWVFRVAAITLLPAGRLPAVVRRRLDHAAVAAVGAVIGSGVAGGVALPALAGRWPVALGAAVTALVAWRRRGLVLPVAAGLLATGLVAIL